MFLWCPGVPALESELRQCIIKVMVVFGQYFIQLLKMLPLGACDAHGCLVMLYILVIVLSSALFFVVGVATGECSWSRSSLNHPGGIADTVGPQLKDLQHCCLGECCLKIQHGEVWRKCGPLVWLHKDSLFFSSCGTYYINVLGWPKYLAPPEFAFNCRVYRVNLHPGVPLFKKFLKDGLPSAHSKVNEGIGQGRVAFRFRLQHPSLYRIIVLTESSTTD